jgi:predicted nucleotidyltransferase
MEPWVSERTIYLTKHGSQAYGTALPDSDTDLKGVCIPPRAYYLGFVRRFEQAESHAPDIVIYELRKFMALAADCNPSIIEVMWTDRSEVVTCTPAGEILLAARHLFLSRKARHTFAGYAMAQLKRIQTHRRWLLSPPAAPPTRAAHGLPERSPIPRDQLMAAESELRRQEGPLLGYDDNFLLLLERERRYRAELQEWEQFQTWHKTRNPRRAALEAKFGYDTKHGMHLVRLLRMCREILDGRGVIVRRPDAAELLAIRAGAWPYDQLLAWAEEQDRALDELEGRSPLPHAPDREALDALCIDLVERALT